MNAPLHPSSALAQPELWTVRLQTASGRTYSVRARTAWAAWQAAAPHLGQPAFSDVECTLESSDPAPAPALPEATAAIVAALQKGPAPLATLRTRITQAGRRHLSTAEVLAAVESGHVRFDHLTQRYALVGAEP